MSHHPPCLVRHAFAPLGLLVATLLGAVIAHADPMIVVDKEVHLYNGTRYVRSLVRGQIVDAKPTADPRFVTVTVDNMALSGERKGLQSQTEATSLAAKRQIDYETAVKASDLEFERRYKRLDLLLNAIVHVERDQALLFRIQKESTLIEFPNSPDTPTQSVAAYRNERVIEVAEARRLEKEWRKEIASLNGEINGLWKKRLDLDTELARFQLDVDALAERFAHWADSAATSDAERYVVVVPSATLYQNQRVRGHLAANAVATARPNPKLTGWLQVKANDQIYDVRADEMMTWRDATDQLIRQRSRISTDLHELTESSALVKNQLATYRALNASLEQVAKVNRAFVVVTDGIEPGFGEVYVIDRPGGKRTLLAIDRSEARSVVKDWADVIENLDKTQKANLQKEADLRKSLVDLAAREAAIRKAMQ